MSAHSSGMVLRASADGGDGRWLTVTPQRETVIMSMTTLTGHNATAALEAAEMVPPPRPVEFTAGATADLRDSMARFSNAADHGPRRASVETAVASIDLAQVQAIAAELMAERLAEGDVDVVAAGWDIPSCTLATALGKAANRQQIRNDIELVVRVIGRGEPSNAAADAATDRLMGLFADAADPVAAVSLLYQNFDATAALLPTMVRAAFAGTGPPATAMTIRVAEAPLQIGEHSLDAGEAVVVDLADMRYGAGPHQCPGEHVANAIVAGAVRAVTDSGYTYNPTRVEIDDRGVPVQFVLEGPQ